MLSDRGHLEEVAKASNSELSFLEAINDVSNHYLRLMLFPFQCRLQQIQIEYTLGPEIHYNPYHVAVVRHHLSRNLEVLFPALRDEIVTSFAEVLDLRANGEEYNSTRVCCAFIWKYLEWKSVTALSVIEKIVCRSSNRAFVGLPLCMFTTTPPLSFVS